MRHVDSEGVTHMHHVVAVAAFVLVLIFPQLLQTWYYLPLGERGSVHTVVRQRLLNATVRIVLFAPARSRDGDLIFMPGGILYNTSKGLGTQVYHDRQTWIVTHDHWALPLDEVSHVILYAADGRVLETLAGNDFRESIRYQDGGTMVMEAPATLRTKAALRPSDEPVRNGEVLHAVYLDKETDALTVTPVVIDVSLQQDGRPSWQLRNLGREGMKAGNSGAGVFREGRLAGNVWLTTRFEVAVPYNGRRLSRRLDTFLSTAAQFPLESLAVAAKR